MKNTKKQKIFEIIGKITVYVLLHAGLAMFGYWAFLQNTIY